MAETGGRMKWREEGGENPLIKNAALREAALNAFSTHAYGETSLNDIIKSADLNKGSFYYRFYDKMDLYLSLFERLGAEKLAVFAQYDGAHAQAGFFDAIRQKAVLGLRFARKEPSYNALYRRFLTEERAFREAVLKCFGGVTESALFRMVEDAQAKGQLRRDVSARMMADVFSILLERIDNVITPSMEDAEILDRVDELIAVLRDGTAKEN